MMNLKRKYKEFKLKVDLAEKKRNLLRTSDSWLELRNLKKKKLALKDRLQKTI